MVNLPYIISGTITDTDSTTPSGAKVVLRNDSNGETTSTTTNSSGEYILDAANLASGYLQTDYLTVYCAWGLAENESSWLISDQNTGYVVNLTLATVADSADVTYCSIQDVWDELGSKTATDISYARVRKTILRSEGEIEDRSGTKFKSTTVTEEIHDYNQYSSWKSPEQLAYPSRVASPRHDLWNTFYNDRIRLKKRPVISITSLYKNSAGSNQTDDWELLSEQTGSSGDFILVDSDTGAIDFVNNVPAFGKRKVKVTYAYGTSTVPKTVERLCILLTVRDIITSKRTESQFDGNVNVNLGGEISINKFDSPTYMNWLNDEIQRLWKIVGDMNQGVA